MSHSVIQQNTSVGSFCYAGTLVMRNTHSTADVNYCVVSISYRNVILLKLLFSGTAVMTYAWPESRTSQTVQDTKSHEQEHSLVKIKHSKKRCFNHGCQVKTSKMKKICYWKTLTSLCFSKSTAIIRRTDAKIRFSAASDAGCLSLTGLLKVVIKRKSFPNADLETLSFIMMTINSSKTLTSG